MFPVILAIRGVKTTKIKELRENRKLSQTELAAMVGVSQPYIHDLENERRGARKETLERIAAALGCTVEELTDEKKAG